MEVNLAEILVRAIVTAMVGTILTAILALLDKIVLKGKAWIAVKRGIKYLTIGKWRVGDGSVIKGDDK